MSRERQWHWKWPLQGLGAGCSDYLPSVCALSTQKQLLPELGLGEKFGQVWSETWYLEGLRKSRAHCLRTWERDLAIGLGREKNLWVEAIFVGANRWDFKGSGPSLMYNGRWIGRGLGDHFLQLKIKSMWAEVGDVPLKIRAGFIQML